MGTSKLRFICGKRLSHKKRLHKNVLEISLKIVYERI